MITPTNHVIVRAGFTLSGTLALWDFRNIFLPNIDEDQKNSYMSGGGPGTGPSVKSIPGYCITVIKRLHGGLS